MTAEKTQPPPGNGRGLCISGSCEDHAESLADQHRAVRPDDTNAAAETGIEFTTFSLPRRERPVPLTVFPGETGTHLVESAMIDTRRLDNADGAVLTVQRDAQVSWSGWP